MTVLSPSSLCELKKMLRYAIEDHNGPIAIRYPRGTDKLMADNGEFVLSKAAVIKSGTDITILAEVVELGD